MSIMTLTDAFVSLGGTDLSAYIRQVSIQAPVEPQDASSMGAGNRKRLSGLKDWSAEIEFNQDFDAAAVDATLWALRGTEFTFIARPTSAVVGANNPQWTGQAILPNYTPLQGSVGDTAIASISIQAADDLVRTVA